MCSPEVAKVVQERIAREGLPQVSRRGLLKMSGAAFAGLAAAGVGLPARRAAAQEGSGLTVVDLSHVYGPGMATYSPGEGPTREEYVTVEANGFLINIWTLFEHSGTHVDFPAHFIAGGTQVADYDPGLLIAPAVVVDISAKAAENPDTTLDVADLEAWEAANGEIPEGAVVIMNSGWDAKWSEPDAFRGTDAEGGQHYPGFSGEAVAWLLENRAVNGIGVDTLSLDPGISTTFDAHYGILGADKYGLENVANAGALPAVGAWVVVGVPRWEASGGGPARLLGLVGM
ncbi:MAG: cyclase family protein [Pleurocapsa minor GSE-CHR-MK-17-07R]|jgi:kynurenine formamidase|nr:cyclase family protein [Pleurocapsa minor GSE-CHR-MK 17-07R]